jgi:hypothetical protein
MHDPLVLYSTVTKLALNVARIYYNDLHYVWCAPVFDGRQAADAEYSVPPTSSPYEIFLALREEIRRGDAHSRRIEENRTGILRGATAKRRSGTISEQQEQEIATIVELAQPSIYEPLILVIPYAGVRSMVSPVPIRERANPLSTESILPALPRHLFDVIRPTES